MDEQKKKRLIYLIGALIVAGMFISSYAAFGNNNVSGSSTTIAPGCNSGYFVTGSYNGITTGYGSSMIVTMPSNAQAVTQNVTDLLSNLQTNGSITEYHLNANGSISVFLSSLSAYQLKTRLTTVSNQLGFDSTEYVMLPLHIKLFYNGQPVTISLRQQNYTITTNSLVSLNQTIPVKVYALVNNTGNVCNNQVSVTSG